MTRFAIVVVDRRADEDDAVLQQARKDVVGAFAAVGLLDHHRDELHAFSHRNRARELSCVSELLGTFVDGRSGTCRVIVPCRRAAAISVRLYRPITSESIVARDEQEINASFPAAAPRTDAPMPPSFSSRARTAAGVRPAALGVARDLRRRRPRPRPSMCSRRATSSSTSAPRDRFGRGLALALAELLPVDVGLHRVDLLIDQPADELLDAAIDLAIEQRLPARRR